MRARAGECSRDLFDPPSTPPPRPLLVRSVVRIKREEIVENRNSRSPLFPRACQRRAQTVRENRFGKLHTRGFFFFTRERLLNESVRDRGVTRDRFPPPPPLPFGRRNAGFSLARREGKKENGKKPQVERDISSTRYAARGGGATFDRP